MRIKALAMLSGGLDSTLAVKVILDQGVEVEAVNFLSPFCLCNKRGATAGEKGESCRHYAREVAEKFGIPFRTIFVGEEYVEMVRSPRHGYGSNLNPCLDCRILTFRKARELFPTLGASFIITGEVLGQRPMSQHRNAMRLIEKESGLQGLVLRPLSANLLEPTIPEKEGWVDRERLLALSGRSRKPQIAMANAHDIRDYPCAAGGCLLTDPGFSHRMRDLLRYGPLTLNEVELLKVGRHFRLSENLRVVVGRMEAENNRIRALARQGEWLFWPQDNHGPLVIARGNPSEDELRTTASLAARYCDARTEGMGAAAEAESGEDEVTKIEAAPLEEAVLDRLRI